jgi:hypothetical protein
VQATLLDDCQRLCSTPTMYRIREQEGESRECRDELVHPTSQKPELLATAPNQLWSWGDHQAVASVRVVSTSISTWFSDVFIRYVPGWVVANGKARHWPSNSLRNPSVTSKGPPASSISTRSRHGNDFQAARHS